MTTLTITRQLGAAVKVGHAGNAEIGDLGRACVGVDALQCRFFALWRVLPCADMEVPAGRVARLRSAFSA